MSKVFDDKQSFDTAYKLFTELAAAREFFSDSISYLN